MLKPTKKNRGMYRLPEEITFHRRKYHLMGISYTEEVAQGAARALRKRGYSVTLYHTKTFTIGVYGRKRS